MSSAALAYALALRGVENAGQLIDLLSKDRRAEVQAVLEKVRELSPEQIRVQLKNLRDEQLNRQRESAKNRIGPKVDHVSPKLSAWLTRPF